MNPLLSKSPTRCGWAGHYGGNHEYYRAEAVGIYLEV